MEKKWCWYIFHASFLILKWRDAMTTFTTCRSWKLSGQRRTWTEKLVSKPANGINELANIFWQKTEPQKQGSTLKVWVSVSYTGLQVGPLATHVERCANGSQSRAEPSQMSQFTDTHRHAGAGGGARCRWPLDGDKRHSACTCSDLGHLEQTTAVIPDMIS